MKNFLIEFFRPLDNLIFNYFVKIGAIKPIIGALIGGAKAFLGSKVGGSIAGSLGSSLLSGITGRRSRRRARRAEARQIALLERAYSQLRDPSDIISQAYSTGMYSPEVMGTILGREKELIPQFQELAEMRARGIRGIQEESKLRQLGLLGALGGVSRELLEDPRLAELAEMDIVEAERLGTEAAAPLSGERAREAEQTALQMAVRQGRGRGQGAIAQTVLGRTAAKTALEEQAAQARQRALQSATAAQVDPSQFLFTPSIEEKIFIGAGLGPQVTDPGQAVNVGSARDVQRANILIGQGALASQAAAARAGMAGQQASALGNILGGIDFSGFGSKGASPMGTVGQGTVLATPAQTAGANLISGFQKLF
jgi:hypothetical protein